VFLSAVRWRFFVSPLRGWECGNLSRWGLRSFGRRNGGWVDGSQLVVRTAGDHSLALFDVAL
jgi:hypothetical protein